MFGLGDVELPIVQAPMAGGPSTPALAAAVCEAGGFGFLAAGYKPAARLREEIAELRSLTGRPFGVNVFAPPSPPASADAAARYAQTLAGEPGPLGEPRHDDDDFAEKVDVIVAERVPVASFTFGLPPGGVVEQLHAADVAVWATVTTAGEARLAADAGADALLVQGAEAGGHRGTYDDAAPGDIGLLALLQLVRAQTDLPLVAAGGIMSGRAVAAVLVAGADAAALGTALMRTPEAGTSAPQRAAMQGDAPTRLTRAFTGRTARGIVNRFLAEHDADAPSAYPDVHHVTAPLRAAGRERGDADVLNLWAGQAYPLADERPAGDLVRAIAGEARAALRDAPSL